MPFLRTFRDTSGAVHTFLVDGHASERRSLEASEMAQVIESPRLPDGERVKATIRCYPRHTEMKLLLREQQREIYLTIDFASITDENL